MENDRYNLVFTGKIRSGFDRDQVVRDFAVTFKIDPVKARAIVLGEQPQIIKPNTAQDKARKMYSAMEAVGMEMELQAVQIPTDLVFSDQTSGSNPGISEDDDSPALGLDLGGPELSVEAELMACPKCSKQQPRSEQCGSCGLVFSKYQHSLESAAAAEYSGAGGTKPRSPRTPHKAKSESSPKGLILLSVGVAVLIGGLFLVNLQYPLAQLLSNDSEANSYGRAYNELLYDAQAMCMDQHQCFRVVQDSVEQCWLGSGVADEDWKNISDARKALFKASYYRCFQSEDGVPMFLDPWYIGRWLAGYCADDNLCLTQSWNQQQTCYLNSVLQRRRGELREMDALSAFETFPDYLRGFLACFSNSSGELLFLDFLADQEQGG